MGYHADTDVDAGATFYLSNNLHQGGYIFIAVCLRQQDYAKNSEHIFLKLRRISLT